MWVLLLSGWNISVSKTYSWYIRTIILKSYYCVLLKLKIRKQVCIDRTIPLSLKKSCFDFNWFISRFLVHHNDPLVCDQFTYPSSAMNRTSFKNGTDDGHRIQGNSTCEIYGNSKTKKVLSQYYKLNRF